MTVQRGLFDPTIDSRFNEFHLANPHVYETLVRYAREALRAGKSRVGMKALWERMRWDFFVTNRSEDYKLNNSYASRYVRLIAQREPDIAALFVTRKLRAA
jgi:hypothetical protein